ncbi:TPA: hypothetical protein IAB95_04095 [Candidatus Ventrenecus avicola]|nr:hypothetical protein [Candidatus Ventrenecus avicola]
MDKISKLNREIRNLEERKRVLEELLKQTEKQQEVDRKEIAKAYEDFYTNKTNTEFVLHDRHPSVEALELYLRYISDRFPLYDFGKLNVKELAEIVKHIYQFKTGQEFDIVTVGAVEYQRTDVYGSLKPHLYFMVGDNKTLEPFREYQGMFVNSDKLFTTIDLNAKGKNLVNIEVDQDHRTPLGIECLTGSFWDEKGTINYSNDRNSYYNTLDASLYKQIFSSHIRSNWGFYSKQKGIKDVMSFYLHTYDSDIAKILISIVIYKRNNHINNLTQEDYNHIFEVLYKEKVDIIGASERDIPRTLTYVPRGKLGKNI